MSAKTSQGWSTVMLQIVWTAMVEMFSRRGTEAEFRFSQVLKLKIVYCRLQMRIPIPAQMLWTIKSGHKIIICKTCWLTYATLYWQIIGNNRYIS